MKKAILALFLVGILAPAAFADAIKTKKNINYKGSITGYKNGKVSIILSSSGNTLKIALNKIKHIEITASADFTNAEKLVAKKKYKQAAAAYEKSARVLKAKWQKALLQDRLNAVLEKAGLISKTVKKWLSLLEDSASEKNIKAAPKNFGNDKAEYLKALKLINRRLRKLDAKDDVDEMVAILKFKIALCKKFRDKNNLKKAKKALGKITGDDSGEEPSSEDGSDKKNQPVKREKAKVLSMKNWKLFAKKLEGGQGGSVIKTIVKNLGKYDEEDLPEVLLYLGWAQLIEGKATGNKKLIQAAGVNLAMVFQKYPDVEYGLPALYLCSEVAAALKNKIGQKNCLDQVMFWYSANEEDPWLIKAKKKLSTFTK